MDEHFTLDYSIRAKRYVGNIFFLIMRNTQYG
jgi:hypothetical protein